MTSFVIIIGLAAVAFVLAFITKRRFGVLGLGLAAGALLAQLWVGDLTPIVARAGIELVRPPLESVVAAAVTVVPALLLLFNGPSYRGMVWRTISALIFAVLVVVFLLAPIDSALVLDGLGKQLYGVLAAHKTEIISAGLILSLLDVFATKPFRHSKSPK